MNRTLKLIIITALVMMALPKVIAASAGSGAMALMFILFYAGYPAYSAFIGWQAGKDIKKMWFLPVLSAGLFLLGAVLVFTPSEKLFYIYAAVYLVIGVLTMAFSESKERRFCDENDDR